MCMKMYGPRGGYSGSNIHDISLFHDGHFQISKPEHKKLPENDQVKINSKSSKNDSYHLILVLSGVVMTLSSFNCENVLPWQTPKKALRVHGLQVAGWAASKQI